VLRGTVEMQDAVLVVGREDGSSLRIPRSQVSFAGKSKEALYQHRTEQSEFRSPAVSIENVKWCMRQGLKEQAETELAKLVAIDPTNPELVRLRRLIDSKTLPQESVPIQMSAAPPPKEFSKAEEFAPPPGLSLESISEFATRVQPMLINRCGNAGCHRSGSDTTWQLSHLGINVRVSARMTQKNIHATIPYINMDDPSLSELLRYAQSPHGAGAYVPVGRSAQSAEMTLRQWLAQLGRYPQPLVSESAFNAPFSNSFSNSLPSVPQVSQSNYNSGDSTSGRWPIQPISHDENIAEGFALDSDGELIYDPDRTFATNRPAIQTEESPNRPKRLPSVPNPFSADIFNRRHQLSEPAAVPNSAP